MPLQKECCSLGLAKQLKTLGFEQSSLFYWANAGTCGGTANYIDHHDKFILMAEEDLPNKEYFKEFGGEYISAFTSSELGEMLPYRIKFLGKFYFLSIWKRLNGGYGIIYKPNKGSNYFPAQVGDTMANAMAKMLVYLKTNNLI